ncbi:MAG TPA: LLM class flavin-dependent oxidoreductase [Actinomycetota bacterium]|nr:LLM class flavin-dependent oxidoreductase [Actinomycetota bacterium]
MPRLACFIEPRRSLEEAVRRVQVAEAAGYESVWVTHIAAREPLQVLAHYAHHTQRIGLGTGVVPVFLRHPALLAMEAATLDESSGGRLSLGIGVSHRVTVEGWYGLELDDPVGRMREYTTIVRDILRTGRADLEGKYHTSRFGLMGFEARPDIPLLFAALAPRMLRLAGQLADGIVLWMCSPAYIRDTVRPLLKEALVEAGRDPAAFEIVAAVPVALTEDAAAARDAFRARAMPYVHLPFYRRAIAAGGHQGDLDAFDERATSGDMSSALGALSDAFCDDYAGIGDQAAVRAKLEEYRAAGVTLPAVSPMGRHRGSADLETVLEAAAG